MVSAELAAVSTVSPHLYFVPSLYALNLRRLRIAEFLGSQSRTFESGPIPDGMRGAHRRPALHCPTLRSFLLHLESQSHGPQSWHDGGPRIPRGSALDNALLYTVDAIRGELEAAKLQYTSRGREIQILQDLKVVVEVLQKLSDMEFHRNSSHRSANLSSTTPACEVPVDREHPVDSGPPKFSQRRQCDSCGHVVCVSLFLCACRVD